MWERGAEHQETLESLHRLASSTVPQKNDELKNAVGAGASSLASNENKISLIHS